MPKPSDVKIGIAKNSMSILSYFFTVVKLKAFELFL